MASACSYINEETNISIAQGQSVAVGVLLHFDVDSLVRKGKEYTYLYGKHVGTGSLTPYIESAFDDRIEE